jgi:hypothetical protein
LVHALSFCGIGWYILQMRFSLLFTLLILGLSSTAYADDKVGSLRGELAFSDQAVPTTLSISQIRAGSFSQDSPDNKYLTFKEQCGYTSRVGFGESVVQCQELIVEQQTKQKVSLTLVAPASK